MSGIKTKGIENIESKMEGVDPESLRYEVLKNARFFKESWIGLGRALYTVWKDKLYKNWGYAEFDTYARKEIGIRKGTAMKLLNSYYFLEKESPEYLKDENRSERPPASTPTFEAIDALRLASKKKALGEDCYTGIRKKVLEEGRDAREVKKDLTQLIREREELSPEDARRNRRETVVRRLISTLASIKKEVEISKLLPAQVAKDIDKLISRLNAEMQDQSISKEGKCRR